jgi:outer membrane protein assembly factor BamB
MDLVTVDGLKTGSGDCLIVKRASDGMLIRAPKVGLESWMTGTPAIADFRGVGSNDVAVSTWENPRIALVDGRNGAVLWQVLTAQPNMNSVTAADVDGDGVPDVLATSFDGHVYAVRGMDGTVLWKTAINPEGSWSVPTVADLNEDGSRQVIVTTANGQLFVLNGLDGKIIWSPDLVGELKVTGRAVVTNINGEKAIIAPMGNAGLVAYDWRHRTELWRSPGGYPVIASGVVCDFAHNGTKQVVAAATNGDVFVLRLTDGKPLWRAKIGQDQTEADPVVADLNGDGVDDILIANHDFHLYAIDGLIVVSGLRASDH